MLFLGLQVIAVIFAVLYHGNGRAITSNNNDNFERMLDLAEEELNTVLNKTNENPTEREENPADVLRLSQSDSSSLEAILSQCSSDNMIQPKEASPVLRQKRSHVRHCYTGNYQTVRLASGGLAAFPICRKVTITGCGSSITKYGMRKCKGSDYETVSVTLNGAIQTKAFPKKCSCAV